MRDYLGNKKDSDVLVNSLKKQYRAQGLDVAVWSEPFEIGSQTYWAVRSNLTIKYPELFKF